MDQLKIGKFISERRKAKGLTQAQLAQMLDVTDRAVSKWETGRSLPDASIMLDLCAILGITVNDLLSGEVIMENYEKEMEKKIIDLVKQKEESDRRLLRIERILGICCLLPLLAAVIIVLLVPMLEWLAAVIVISSLLPLIVAVPVAIKIEQKAGYYQCQKCGHKYVPRYASVFMAMHVGTTRYMRCPECRKCSWQKKVISKD